MVDFLHGPHTHVPSHVITRRPGEGTPLEEDTPSANMCNSDFSDFAGNLSHPNVLFARAIHNIYQRTGQHPAIRPGGITADSAWFKADATLAIERDLSPVSSTQ